MNLKLIQTSFIAATLAASAFGCGGTGNGADGIDPERDQVGDLELLLSTVPDDAFCLEVTLAGSRSTTKRFDLTPGSMPKLLVDQLPIGIVKVDAKGFSEACAKVKATSLPNWFIEKTLTVQIDPLEVAKILLKLIRNGRAEIAVDFEPPPWFSASKAPIDIAVIGDTPYGAAQIEDFPNLLATIDADARISSVLHLGDIKNGSSRCDDSYFAQIAAGFSSLTIPMIFTPGDNEWTDCHRANNGAYDPLERLAALRSVFFPVPGLTLGGGFKQVLSQSEFAGFESFVENQIWFEAGVAFGAVHVVGSNDSKPAWYTDDTTGTKMDDPARREAEAGRPQRRHPGLAGQAVRRRHPEPGGRRGHRHAGGHVRRLLGRQQHPPRFLQQHRPAHRPAVEGLRQAGAAAAGGFALLRLRPPGRDRQRRARRDRHRPQPGPHRGPGQHHHPADRVAAAAHRPGHAGGVQLGAQRPLIAAGW